MTKKVIVSVGNPGQKYQKTRHNVGVMFVESCFEVFGSSATRWSEKSDIYTCELSVQSGSTNMQCAFLFPQTYMNNSGVPLKQYLSKKGIDLNDVIVCHDELDIPFGDVRYKFGGGEAGHNGLKSISQMCGSKDYARIRIGIGKPSQLSNIPDFAKDKAFKGAETSIVDWVLSEFSRQEFDKLNSVFEKGREILVNWLKS